MRYHMGELDMITWDKGESVRPILRSGVSESVLGGETLDEISEIHEIALVLKLRPAQEVKGHGIQAEIIDICEFWEQFPSWEGDFKSAELSGMHDRCKQVLGLAGVHFPDAMHRWLSTGYSAYANIAKLRDATPKRQAVTDEELARCERHVDGVLLPVGVVEEVQMHELYEHVVVFNVVVPYKEGKMNRLCWYGKPINKGLDQNTQ